MTKYSPVENNIALARDNESQAIVSINRDELMQVRHAKKIRRQLAAEAEQMKHDVDLLKNELSEIKDLLRKVVEK